MLNWARLRLVLPAIVFGAVLFFVYANRFSIISSTQASQRPSQDAGQPVVPAPGAPVLEDQHPTYKNITTDTSSPVQDAFPYLATALNLPPVPRWNVPPDHHVEEQTPLFIGFSRNWPVLQQCVVSYIAAGWPPGDIYVVDNSGTMFSNEKNLLTLQNPAYLDYTRLTQTLGVNVVTTPTLLTFAQLQNLYLFHAKQNRWAYYFWSHMDATVLSDEEYVPYASFYIRAVETLRETLYTANTPANDNKPWGTRFFAYDTLTLANVAAYTVVGGFDTFIPFYTSDCDFHFRLSASNYTMHDATIGLIYDVGRSLPDLRHFLREDTAEMLATCASNATTDSKEYKLGDCRFLALKEALEGLEYDKSHHDGGRNYWQGRQRGGQGEPFYRDAEGVDIAMKMVADHGRTVYAEKWGHRGCDLRRQGLRPDDAWRVEHDW